MEQELTAEEQAIQSELQMDFQKAARLLEQVNRLHGPRCRSLLLEATLAFRVHQVQWHLCSTMDP